MSRATWAFVLACTRCVSTPSSPGEDGRDLVRRVVEAHGAERLADATVDFELRGTRYRMTRSEGRYRYERWPAPNRHEVLTNRGYVLYVDGEPAKISKAAATAKGRSLNSVVYFASLPYVLMDEAVRPRAEGRQAIGDEVYEVLEVRFVPEGGGADHDDVFRYWIDPETDQLAFLAYRFERGAGGVRFRVRDGATTTGGVTFVDWTNFGLSDAEISLASLPERWMRRELPELSKIALEGVEVTDPRFPGSAEDVGDRPQR